MKKRCEQCGNPMYYDEDFCTKCYPEGWGPAPGNIKGHEDTHCSDIKSWKAFQEACWPQECKDEIKRLKKSITFKNLKTRCKRYSNKHF